jgi:hypothetical protein
LQHFPGLDSYLSEVDRFALDMRKRSTVPTDCRYIDARVAESVTTALYVAQTTPASSRPAPPSCTRSVPRSPPGTP